jgi:plastocyanin
VAFAPGAASKLDDGDIDLDRGDSVDVAFTPQTPGTYEMHCTHPFHAMLGMKGQIVVR